MKKPLWKVILGYSAKILGILLSIIILLFLFGEGIPEISKVTDREKLMFLALGLMILGSVLGIWDHIVAACVIFAGFGAFLYLDGGLYSGPLVLLFGITALFHLLAGIGRKDQSGINKVASE